VHRTGFSFALFYSISLVAFVWGSFFHDSFFYFIYFSFLFYRSLKYGWMDDMDLCTDLSYYRSEFGGGLLSFSFSIRYGFFASHQ